VAVYVRSLIPSSMWNASSDDPTYELLWVEAGCVIIGALYHPPRTQYSQQSLLDYIEQAVDDLSKQFPYSVIVGSVFLFKSTWKSHKSSLGSIFLFTLTWTSHKFSLRSIFLFKSTWTSHKSSLWSAFLFKSTWTSHKSSLGSAFLFKST